MQYYIQQTPTSKHLIHKDGMQTAIQLASQLLSQSDSYLDCQSDPCSWLVG